MHIENRCLISVYKKDVIEGKIIIPNGINEIKSNAFFTVAELLKEVVLPESLILINDCAFKGCKSLQKMVIPKSVKYIFSDAFADCFLLHLNFESSLNHNFFRRDFKDVYELVIYNNKIKLNIDTFNDEVSEIRKKELQDIIIKKIKSNNYQYIKYSRNSIKREIEKIINKIVYNIKSKSNYNYDDVLDVALKELNDKYAPQLPVTIEQKSLIEEKTKEQIYKIVCDYDVNNLTINNINGIINCGNELNVCPVFITGQILKLISLKNNDNNIISEIKKSLDKLGSSKERQLFLKKFFLKKTEEGNLIGINNEEINNLVQFIEKTNGKLTQENDILEYLKEIICIYVEKMNEQIDNLEKYVYTESNGSNAELVTSDNETINNIINSKINDMYEAILIMIQEYKKINNLLCINAISINKFNNIKNVFLPTLLSDTIITNRINDGKVRIEALNSISNILGEMILENKKTTIESQNKSITIEDLKQQIMQMKNEQQSILDGNDNKKSKSLN